MTKAEEIYNEVEKKTSGGMSKPDAFREIATARGIKFDSVRGAYYTHKKVLDGGGEAGSGRTRTRETTLEDAVASARATLERAIANIDRELVAAEERATETAAEFEAMKKSAPERKTAIEAKLKALD